MRIKREHLDAWIEGQPLAEVAPGRIELSPEQLAELAREIVRQIRMAESRL